MMMKVRTEMKISGLKIWINHMCLVWDDDDDDDEGVTQHKATVQTRLTHALNPDY